MAAVVVAIRSTLNPATVRRRETMALLRDTTAAINKASLQCSTNRPLLKTTPAAAAVEATTV